MKFGPGPNIVKTLPLVSDFLPCTVHKKSSVKEKECAIFVDFADCFSWICQDKVAGAVVVARVSEDLQARAMLHMVIAVCKGEPSSEVRI